MSDQLIRAAGGGGKKGGSARTPVEHPDSLHSTARARVLLAISEGPIAGPSTGDENFLQSVYLDGTPIQNSDFSYNFPDAVASFTHGTQDQDYLKGFAASENTVNVGTQLQAGRPWTQRITNRDLSAVTINIGTPQLVATNQQNYDRTGTRVNYRIQLQVDDGPFADVLSASFVGKTTRGYERSHRINLPRAQSSWTIRVIRDTPDSSSDMLVNSTYIGSYTEIIDSKLRYPMTALLGLSLSAEHFNGIPTVAYRAKGRVISVPSNYDPVTRNYSGIWDGSFKNAWTDNPAWIFYDLITNDRYGLGRRIQRHQIDRYTLYQIGRYCDELVPDGFGGAEPRFTCNVYIQKASDAYRVISDLASIFRGMSYWAAGMIRVNADIPSDPVYTFTNANVKNGSFTPTGSGRRSRYSVVAVSYNDMDDFGRQKVEFVQDDAAVRRYGIRELEITAFGCTSRGQAYRIGKYALVTSQIETGGISFVTGIENIKVQPGDVIRVQDQHRAGRRYGGRVKERVSANSLILDSAEGISAGSTLRLEGYQGTITAVNGDLVSVSVVLPTDIEQAIWSVESSDLKPELYRVVSIKELSGDKLEYQIDAVAHEPQKYSIVDHDSRLEPYPTTVVPPRVQEAPKDVTLSSFFVIKEGVSKHTLTISWKKAPSAVKYEVQYRRDNSEWVNLPVTGATSIEIDDVYSGSYDARVRAINGLDVPSLWAYSDLTEIDGLTGEPPRITGLTTEPIPWGIVLRWSFPSGANVIERTELRYSRSPDFKDSKPLGEHAYPTNTFVHDSLAPNTEIFYWARLIDKNGLRGKWYPLESEQGVRGKTSSNADEYNDLITKEIVESALGEQLISDIESIPDIKDTIDGLGGKIDLLEDKTNSIDEHIDRLGADVSDIEDQLSNIGVDLDQIGIRFDEIEDKFYATDAEIDALQAQISEILGTEEWSQDRTYLEGTLVQSDGALYRAQKDVPAGVAITDTEYWVKVGDYASIGDAVSSLLARMSVTEANVNSLTGQVTAISQDVTVLASDLQSVDGRVSANTAAISDTKAEVTELDGKVTANSSAINSLSSSITDLDGKVQGNASAIDRLETEVVDLDGQVTAIAEREALIVASLRDEDDGHGQLAEVLNIHQNRAWIRENQTAIVTNEKAIARVETELGSRIDENSSYINQVFETIADLEGSQSTISQELWSAVNDNKSAIQSNSQTITDNKAAQAEINDQLSSRIDDADAGNAANANAINTLKTRVDGHDDDLVSQAQSIGQLEAGLTDAQSGIEANASAISEVDTKVTAIDGRVTANTSNISKLQTDLTSLDGSVGANSQAISALTTRVDDHDGQLQSQAQSITALETGLDDANAGISANSGAITQLSSDVSAIDGVVKSHSQSITKLENDLVDVDGGVQANSQAIQSLDNRVTQVDGKVEANSAQITALESEITTLDGEVKGNAQAIEKIETNVTELDGQIEVITQKESLIIASLRDTDDGHGQLADVLNTHQNRAWIRQNQIAISNNTESIARVETDLGAQMGNNTALINDLSEAFADNVSAQAVINNTLLSLIEDTDAGVSANTAAVNGLKTRVDDHDGVLSTHGSAITQLQSSLTDAEQGITANAGAINSLSTSVTQIDNKLTAQAQSINQIDSKVGNVSASVQDLSRTVTSIDGKVSATRTIKVGVNTGGTQYLAGIGVGVDNSTGVTQSQVVVVADRFSVLHTINGTPKAVFSVQGGTTFINDAMIRNASITDAKIANLAVTEGKIANLAVTEGKIANLAVTRGKIRDLAVDTLKIAGNAVTVMGSSNHGSVALTIPSMVTNSVVLNSPVPSVINVTVTTNFSKAQFLPSVTLLVNGSAVAVIHTEMGIPFQPPVTRDRISMSYLVNIPSGVATIQIRQESSHYSQQTPTTPTALSVLMAMR